jgi:hypothetical protein
LPVVDAGRHGREVLRGGPGRERRRQESLRARVQAPLLAAGGAQELVRGEEPLTEVIDRTHPLDWVVIGAASNGRRYFQPDPEHIRRLLLVMDATGTPVFYKGNIHGLFEANDLGTAELNRWREDFPCCYRDGTPIPAVVRRDRMSERHGWTRSRFRLPVVSDD